MTDWLTEKELLLKDPIVPPTQDSLPPPKVALVQMEREVLNMKKRKTASRIAHNLAPGQPHTYKHPQTCAEHFPEGAHPKRGVLSISIYRLYLKHWSSQIRSIPRHQRHSLFYLHLTRTMHLKTYLEQSCKIFDPQHWRLMGIFRNVQGETSTSKYMQCTPQ